MAHFEFRFEAILRLRHDERDAARLRVAEAQQALEIVAQRIRDVEQDRGQLRGEISGASVGRVTVDQLLRRGRYDLQLAAERRELQVQHGQIEQEIARRQQRLMVAEQECRKLEKLRAIMAERHRADELRHQQAALDEIATQRAARRASQRMTEEVESWSGD